MPETILPPLPSLDHCQIRHMPGFPGYAITDNGEAWSSRPWKSTMTSVTWKKMRCCIDTNSGYVVVTLRAEKQSARRVHGLVLTAFTGPRPYGMLVRHLNGCRSDNRLSNLAWGTARENWLDLLRHRHEGYRNSPVTPLGDTEMSVVVALPIVLPLLLTSMLPPLPSIAGLEVRHIANFPGYAITSDGEVMSCKNMGYGRSKYGLTWHTHQQTTAKSGYRMVSFTKDKKSHLSNTHKIMLETFIGPRPDGYVCCHNNGVRNDNRLSNLRWDTKSANSLDRHAHGTVASSKLNTTQVMNIREKYKNGLSQSQLAREFHVTQSCIWSIVSRKTWKHVP